MRLDTFSVVGEKKGALLAFLRSSENSCWLSLADPLRKVQPGFLDRSQWIRDENVLLFYGGEETGNKQERVVCI